MGILSIICIIVLLLIVYIMYKNYDSCKFDPMCYLNVITTKIEDIKNGNFNIFI